MLKNVSKNILKKKIICPNCNNQMIFEASMGQVVIISCSNCQKQWNIEVKNSLKEVFSWNHDADIADNFSKIKKRFKGLSWQTKLSFFLMFILINVFISALAVFFTVRF